MACEIERKFLVDPARWTPQGKSVKIIQGYLVRSEKVSVRLRLAGDQAFLTLKGPTAGISRSEFEYTIPTVDAMQMLQEFSDGNFIFKTRYYIPAGERCWEVDVFEKDNAPLIIAEIELADENESFEKPDWLLKEVSGDKRYRNACLAAHPYSQWATAEKE